MYTIMNFDTELAKFNIQIDRFGHEQITNITICDNNICNILGCNSVENWVKGRKPYVQRKQVANILARLGINNLSGYFSTTHGLTLTDALWIKPDQQPNLKWANVNLYHNSFNQTIAHFAFDGTGEIKGTVSPEYGTDGKLAKCWKRVNNNIYLYKRGSEGSCNCGREPYSEAYTTQLIKALKGYTNYVSYEALMYHNKETSRCPIFTSEQIGFKPQAKVFKPRTFEELFEQQMKSPYADDIRFMYILDALILNEDRHLNNYGYLTDNKTGNITGFAPIFDNGLSFLAYYMFNKTGADNLNDMLDYANTLRMSCDADFILVAKQCMDNNIKQMLRNLKGFKLKPVLNDTQHRADCLTHIIMEQLRKLLS